MPTLKPPRFNDGIVNVYRQKERKTDFNARLNPSTLEDMEHIVKLAYQESSKRQQDLEFAEQSGFDLSMKIRTRYVRSVRSKMKAVIDGYLYEISYIDTDRAKLEMFLFLQGIRELEEGEPGAQ